MPRFTAAGRTLGFQSKLLIMLLTVSVISVLIAGLIGYVSGTNALRKAEYARLIQLRESRSREIVEMYQSSIDAATVLTHSAATIDAMKDFTAAFAELQKAPLPPGAPESLTRYYNDVFGPKLEQGTGENADPELFRPTSNAQSYLQSLYTVPAKGDFNVSVKTRSAGDSSKWSALNAQFQPFFSDFANRLGFDDALLIDTDGNVVYSTDKKVDLGANLLGPPYESTSLAAAFRKTLKSTSVDDIVRVDYEAYAPSYGKPTPWLLTPIGDAGGIYGVLALQLSVDEINRVMTANRGWDQEGLGETGETYLAGSDRTMRSLARELENDPQKYFADVIANGTPEEIAKRQIETGRSSLLQSVNTPAVNEALAGKSGVFTAKTYLGPEAMLAYAPVAIPDLNWVIVAKIDTAEALAPVKAFARNVALSTAAVVLGVCLLALLFSRILTRPIRTLVAAVNRVSGGDVGVTVPVTSNDELGQLASAFNELSASLQVKQQLIEEQRHENDKLLGSLMPEAEARRYRDGEENISTQHRDVSVIYAQLLGFDEFSRSLRSEESVSILNLIVEAFDGAAERHGIEQVRSMQDNGLLATCGLVVPRVDHASRAIAFADELADIVQRFNDQHGSALAVRAGIDSGSVTSGLVGERSTVYALWGEAVDLAHRVHGATKTPGIFVSGRVHDVVVGIYSFTEAGTITDAIGTETVWRLDTTARHPV